MKWIIDKILAKSSRPGYPSIGISASTVKMWLDDAKKEGIKSVICMMTAREMRTKYRISTSLPNIYKLHGLICAWVPTPDSGNDDIPFDSEQKVIEAYEKLPKPVLIHCSAGMQRSGAAVSAIVRKIK